MDVKLICDRLMTSLIQINRKFQLNGQFGETLEVDARKEKLYRIRRIKENRPIRYNDDDDTEDCVRTVVGGVDPLITLINDKISQNVQNFRSAGGSEHLANAGHRTVQLSRKRGEYFKKQSKVDAEDYQGAQLSHHNRGGLHDPLIIDYQGAQLFSHEGGELHDPLIKHAERHSI